MLVITYIACSTLSHLWVAPCLSTMIGMHVHLPHQSLITSAMNSIYLLQNAKLSLCFDFLPSLKLCVHMLYSSERFFKNPLLADTISDNIRLLYWQIPLFFPNLCQFLMVSANSNCMIPCTFLWYLPIVIVRYPLLFMVTA